VAERSEFIDAVRAFAIVPVMLHHIYSPAAPGGGLGVSVFFVLSGYLIGRSVFGDSGTRAGCAYRFAVRRVFRIVPMYYLAIACVAYFAWITERTDADELLRSLLGSLIFVQTDQWFGYSVGVWWTLSTEMMFYSIVASLVLWLGPSRLAQWSPVFWVASLPLYWSDLRVIWCLPDLFLGLCLNAPRVQRINLSGAAPLVSLVMIGALYATILPGTPGMEVSHHVVAVCTAAVILYASRHAVWGWSFPGLSHIGRISYSLYLVHALVLDFAPPWFEVGPPDDAGRIMRFFGISLVISAATYVLIERQGNMLGRVFLRRTRGWSWRHPASEIKPVG
jgi:peptidoglycan/LPS O-acetylase OafA/YrhL